MAAPADVPLRDPQAPPDNGRLASILKKLLGGKDNTLTSSIYDQDPNTSVDCAAGAGLIRKLPRRVVPGLPRAKTFKRQQSEGRERLEATKLTSEERRPASVSVAGRLRPQRSISRGHQDPLRSSAPGCINDTRGSTIVTPQLETSVPQSPFDDADEKRYLSIPGANGDIGGEHHEVSERVPSYTEALSPVDVQSTTSSQYETMINEELERKWILNLSMHFRDKSRREKFFVTYRESEYVWRRVTISLDYRNAPDDSLEKDLLHIKFQREKSAKIYEAIRESLQDIQFYNTVTNLKLQTTDGRLHVHVVEDVNEIINYPTTQMIQHLKCQCVKEKDLEFDSHMSGFVYKVRVNNKTLIKKEIPGPDTVDEFLYEVNALNSLRFSRSVIEFYGVVVDDEDETVKGLLINYAEKGALIDVIYDSQEDGNSLPWSLREKWARQIVQGLSDVHEAGFVQGDLTLSNIVIDYEDNAKIIDINRRGCPVGWEPPEATALIDSNQRISMYIGVKSDLYQLGMVLWALATQEDEPEAHQRPLRLDPEIDVPGWYRTMVEYCLHEDPRVRLQATVLLKLFPQPEHHDDYEEDISANSGASLREYTVDGYQSGGNHAHLRTIQPRNVPWSYDQFGSNNAALHGFSDEYYYPSRGRSPPRSLPSNHEMYSPPYIERPGIWPNDSVDPSTGNIEPEEEDRANTPKETQMTAEAVAEVQRDLSRAEAGQAYPNGGENQTKVVTLATGADDQAPEAANEDIDRTLPLPSNDTAAITTTNGTNTTVASYRDQALENPGSETNGKTLKQNGVVRADEPRDVGTAVNFIQYGAVQPHSDGEVETESSNYYTHDRREISTRLTGASPPIPAEHSPIDVPTDLTGVGTFSGKEEDCGKFPAALSAEDLGIQPTATTSSMKSHA